ncbi:type II secretion system F family protein [Rothia sp. CCM 9417]|uniref:type II secretion system F family protein n=1 Tax=Rothia sp. CCM 9417 TaxID=3402657 RepID=UPI003AE815B0
MNSALLLAMLLATGMWLVYSSVTRHRTEDFSDRIAPQLRAAELRNNRGSEPYATLPEGLYGASMSLLGPWVEKAYKAVGSSSFDPAGLEKRIDQLGGGLTIAEYRVQQVLWCLSALMMGTCLVALGAAQGKIGLIPGLILIALAGMSGYLGRDYWLSQQIKKREKAMLAEFPALAELMALSVTAGESALGSLERVVRSSNGELAQEFKEILAMTRTGEPLVSALQNFSQRTSVAALARFVDGLVVAIERGTPLADVLRAQAQDVRDNAKRELMETAGKKEIGMMAPVVFLILPLTVLFAMFPGISLLNLNF